MAHGEATSAHMRLDRRRAAEAISARAVVLVERRSDELASFRTFQTQPAWHGRARQEQLRRFLGTTSGRKIESAPLLVDALDLSRVPRPLDRVLARV